MQRFMKLMCLLIALSFLVIAGCGGGGTNPLMTITGTASQGAPLAVGTTVFLKDANGTERTVVITDANGFFSIPVNGLTAPFVLRAANFYSFATGPGTVNINPFTNLCVVTTLRRTDLAVFYNQLSTGSAGESVNALASKYQTTAADLRTSLAPLFPSDVPEAQKDFLNGDITIDQGVDKLFDHVDILSSDSGFIIKSRNNAVILISGTRQTNGTIEVTKDAAAITNFNQTITPDVPSVASTAKLTIAPTGTGTYVIRAENFPSVATLDLTISYDTSVLGNPIVTVGSLASGALMVPNYNIPGLIRIGLITTKPITGGGIIANISFASQTGSCGITSFIGRLTDIDGKGVPVRLAILAQ